VTTRQIPAKPINPLVSLVSTGVVKGSLSLPSIGHQHHYKVECRDCGDVTLQESGEVVTDAPMAQASMYARRHLDRHLLALAEEIRKFNR